jgi:hypothetical protein
MVRYLAALSNVFGLATSQDIRYGSLLVKQNRSNDIPFKLFTTPKGLKRHAIQSHKVLMIANQTITVRVDAEQLNYHAYGSVGH